MNHNEKTDIPKPETSDSAEVKFGNEWRPPQYEPKTPKIIMWLIKYSGGIIKTEKLATSVILGFVVLAITVSLFLIFTFGATSVKRGGSGPSQSEMEAYKLIQTF